MGTPLLLVATGTRWIGTARISRPLARAGFDVTLLAPPEALAQRSGYLTQVAHFPPNATPLQWVESFAHAVRLTGPRLVVPCDDTAFWLMQMLVLAPPDALQASLRLQLAALLVDSLGDPAHYRDSVEKTRLPAAASALGVRVPPWARVAQPADALAFAAGHGYPIVLKRDHSSAGDGVEIVGSAAAVPTAFARLRGPGTSIQAQDNRAPLLAQAAIPGAVHYENAVAWRGERRAGYAVERLEGATANGPPSVIACFASPEIRDFTARLARGFGITGFFAPEYIVHRDTGEAYLIELNRRVTPGSHVGAYWNVDLPAQLFAALHDRPAATRGDMDPGERRINVHFPQEWLRDPDSRWLREHPVDVPWDEPALIEAFLAMRHLD